MRAGESRLFFSRKLLLKIVENYHQNSGYIDKLYVIAQMDLIEKLNR
jgi:hypothetical protein